MTPLSICIAVAVVAVAAAAWDALRRAIAARAVDDRAKLHDVQRRLGALESSHAQVAEDVRQATTAQAMRRR